MSQLFCFYYCIHFFFSLAHISKKTETYFFFCCNFVLFSVSFPLMLHFVCIFLPRSFSSFAKRGTGLVSEEWVVLRIILLSAFLSIRIPIGVILPVLIFGGVGGTHFFYPTLQIKRSFIIGYNCNTYYQRGYIHKYVIKLHNGISVMHVCITFDS